MLQFHNLEVDKKAVIELRTFPRMEWLLTYFICCILTASHWTRCRVYLLQSDALCYAGLTNGDNIIAIYLFVY